MKRIRRKIEPTVTMEEILASEGYSLRRGRPGELYTHIIAKTEKKQKKEKIAPDEVEELQLINEIIKTVVRLVVNCGIVIDGSLATGKGTVIDLLQEEKCVPLSNGTLYRSVSKFCFLAGIFDLQTVLNHVAKIKSAAAVKDSSPEVTTGVKIAKEELADYLKTQLLTYQEAFADLAIRLLPVDTQKKSWVRLQHPAHLEMVDVQVDTDLRTPEIDAVVSTIAGTEFVISHVESILRELVKTTKLWMVDGRDGYLQFGGMEGLVLIGYFMVRRGERNRRILERYKASGRELSQEVLENLIDQADARDNADKQKPLGQGKLLTREEAQDGGLYDFFIDTTELTPRQVQLGVLTALVEMVSYENVLAVPLLHKLRQRFLPHYKHAIKIALRGKNFVSPQKLVA